LNQLYPIFWQAGTGYHRMNIERFKTRVVGSKCRINDKPNAKRSNYGDVKWCRV